MDATPFPVPRVEHIQAFGAKVHGIFEPLMIPFEATVRSTFPNFVADVDALWNNRLHEFSAQFPLINPYTVFFALAVYLTVLVALILLSRVLGKLQLRAFGIVYNLCLTLLSLYMWAGLMYEAWRGGYSLWNNPVSPPGTHRDTMGTILWIYVASKIPEFTDTFVMALKHNYRQISFLHVYHHCSVIMIYVVGFMDAPGGDLYWGAMLNSGIHVPMYAYYMLNLVFPSGPVRNFLAKYKFFITYGQITQFTLIVSHTVYTLFWLTDASRQYSAFVMKYQGYYALSLMTLFVHFLVTSKKQRRQVKAAPSADAKKRR